MSRALLVIDFLNDFIKPGAVLECGPAGRAAVQAAQVHLATARSRKECVIYLCDRHRPDDREFELFAPHCLEGTDGADIVSELAPKPCDIVVPKRHFSGFYGTDLDALLRELGITHLQVMGVCTNICVLYTVADARMRGYQVTILRDAVASFAQDAHEAALKELEYTLKAKMA